MAATEHKREAKTPTSSEGGHREGEGFRALQERGNLPPPNQDLAGGGGVRGRSPSFGATMSFQAKTWAPQSLRNMGSPCADFDGTRSCRHGAPRRIPVWLSRPPVPENPNFLDSGRSPDILKVMNTCRRFDEVRKSLVLPTTRLWPPLSRADAPVGAKSSSAPLSAEPGSLCVTPCATLPYARRHGPGCYPPRGPRPLHATIGTWASCPRGPRSGAASNPTRCGEPTSHPGRATTRRPWACVLEFLSLGRLGEMRGPEVSRRKWTRNARG